MTAVSCIQYCLLHCWCSLLQYLGFGVPASESPGRRAASLADQAHQSAATSAEEDNAEKDAYLKQVEARDLIEFGMIPVSSPSIWKQYQSFDTGCWLDITVQVEDLFYFYMPDCYYRLLCYTET